MLEFSVNIYLKSYVKIVLNFIGNLTYDLVYTNIIDIKVKLIRTYKK